MDRKVRGKVAGAGASLGALAKPEHTDRAAPGREKRKLHLCPGSSNSDYFVSVFWLLVVTLRFLSPSRPVSTCSSGIRENLPGRVKENRGSEEHTHFSKNISEGKEDLGSRMHFMDSVNIIKKELHFLLSCKKRCQVNEKKKKKRTESESHQDSFEIQGKFSKNYKWQPSIF